MKRKTSLAKRARQWYWTAVAMAMPFILTVQPVFAADTVWTKFSDVMKDIYGKLLRVSTIIAVTAATIALLVRMMRYSLLARSPKQIIPGLSVRMKTSSR